jgi:cellular nucleic acid-binding protein
VLELADARWYVGKTTNLAERVRQHASGSGGSEWTRMFAVVRVAEDKPMTGPHDESNTTLEYMRKYGMDNVRGGPFCKPVLEDSERAVIRQQINALRDVCYLCGLPGHFAGSCRAVPRVASAGSAAGPVKGGGGHVEVLDFDDEDEDESSSGCTRCGRDSHTAAQCYATTAVAREAVSSVCTRCGRDSHTAAARCYAKTHEAGHRL